MKSLVVFSYKQSVNGSKIRFGVLEHVRDTKTDRLSPRVFLSRYRYWDCNFKRSRNIMTVRNRGYRQFYAERTEWKITIPFIGSIIGLFI